MDYQIPQQDEKSNIVLYFMSTKLLGETIIFTLTRYQVKGSSHTLNFVPKFNVFLGWVGDYNFPTAFFMCDDEETLKDSLFSVQLKTLLLTHNSH